MPAPVFNVNISFYRFFVRLSAKTSCFRKILSISYRKKMPRTMKTPHKGAFCFHINQTNKSIRSASNYCQCFYPPLTAIQPINPCCQFAIPLLIISGCWTGCLLTIPTTTGISRQPYSNFCSRGCRTDERVNLCCPKQFSIGGINARLVVPSLLRPNCEDRGR